MIFKDHLKYYFLVIIIGILAGTLCAVLDIIPGNNIWTFSSFSGSLGFWAITGMLILMQSENRKAAGINTFLYFTFMNSAFFFVYLLLPIQYPRITSINQAIIGSLEWAIASFICGICALIAYEAKKDNWKGIIALSLPTGLLLSEGISTLLSVFINHKFLFQTIVDIIGLILLFMLYKKNKKTLYLVLAIIGVASLILIFELIVNHNILYY